MSREGVAGSHNPWIVRPAARGAAGLRLFCFPYAGGSAATYQRWPRAFPADVEVCAVELPGRGSRAGEAPYHDFFDLVVVTAEALEPELGARFGFYGHSMGALLAFELSRYLRREIGREPEWLVVSACPGPRMARRLSAMSGLPDQELMKEMSARFGGIPEAILHEPSLWETMIPALRADLRAAESHTYTEDRPLTCSLLAIGGEADHTVDEGELDAWRNETLGLYRSITLPGGHFFLHDEWQEVTRSIRGIADDRCGRAPGDMGP